jgi:acyl-coenzyme A thioesterase 13
MYKVAGRRTSGCLYYDAFQTENLKTTMGSPEAAIRFLELLKGSEEGARQYFDAGVLQDCEMDQVACVKPGVLTCSIRVTPSVQNRFGILHGGCIASLVDIIGTAAVMSMDGRPGKSVGINVSYLQPGQADSLYEVHARVVSKGQSLATIIVDIIDPVSKGVVSHGTHVKYMSKNDVDLGHVLFGSKL